MAEPARQRRGQLHDEPDTLFAAAAAAPAAASSACRARRRLSRAEHDRMANAIRALAMDAVEQAKSGHPGLPMGAADIATVLFTRFLKFDPADPHWPDRDRFVLSAGHGSMLLYALLYLARLRGDDDRARSSASASSARSRRAIRNMPSRPASRPPPARSARASPTRSAWRSPSATSPREFGDDIVDHHTYVLASDGDLMEGISQEAIALAGHLKLNKLIVLFDDNGISIDGPLSLCRLGRSGEALRGRRLGGDAHRRPRSGRRSPRRSTTAQTSDRPTLIACRTTIGFGAPTKAGTDEGARLAARRRRDRGRAREARLDVAAVRDSRRHPRRWRAAGARGKPARARLEQAPRRARRRQRAEFERAPQRRAAGGARRRPCAA